MTPRPSKYRNKPVEVDGIRFPSQREAKRWGELKLLERAGEITELRRQARFPLEVNGELVCTYVADFVMRDKAGNLVVEDSKGFVTDVYKIKRKLMAAVHGIEIVEV